MNAMDTLLIGLLMNSLEPGERLEVEELLRRNPEAGQRLETLRRLFAHLESDRDEPALMPDRAVRTMAHIAEYTCRTLPSAPIIHGDEAIAPRSWYRRLDFLVAACLLVTALGLGVPYVLRQRTLADRAVCQDRLRTFHAALAAFHDQHDAFPNPNAETSPRNVAGMVVPLLRQAGTLPVDADLRCPGRPVPVHNLTLADWRGLPEEEFGRFAPGLNPTYAYSLGYQDAAGHHGPRREKDLLGSVLPLMSDLPPAEVQGNSPNHDGRGQNVLYHDGHVRFVTDRGAGFQKDDIFLNRNHRIGAGLDLLDAVLGSSSSRP